MTSKLASPVRANLKVPCGFCQGEGTVLSVGRPGAFSRELETFLPSETFSECPLCFGQGKLEVCGGCLEPFQIVRGREVCGCATLQLSRAA